MTHRHSLVEISGLLHFCLVCMHWIFHVFGGFWHLYTFPNRIRLTTVYCANTLSELLILIFDYFIFYLCVVWTLHLIYCSCIHLLSFWLLYARSMLCYFSFSVPRSQKGTWKSIWTTSRSGNYSYHNCIIIFIIVIFIIELIIYYVPWYLLSKIGTHYRVML